MITIIPDEDNPCYELQDTMDGGFRTFLPQFLEFIRGGGRVKTVDFPEDEKDSITSIYDYNKYPNIEGIPTLSSSAHYLQFDDIAYELPSNVDLSEITTLDGLTEGAYLMVLQHFEDLNPSQNFAHLTQASSSWSPNFYGDTTHDWVYDFNGDPSYITFLRLKLVPDDEIQFNIIGQGADEDEMGLISDSTGSFWFNVQSIADGGNYIFDPTQCEVYVDGIQITTGTTPISDDNLIHTIRIVILDVCTVNQIGKAEVDGYFNAPLYDVYFTALVGNRHYPLDEGVLNGGWAVDNEYPETYSEQYTFDGIDDCVEFSPVALTTGDSLSFCFVWNGNSTGDSYQYLVSGTDGSGNDAGVGFVDTTGVLYIDTNMQALTTGIKVNGDSYTSGNFTFQENEEYLIEVEITSGTFNFRSVAVDNTTTTNFYTGTFYDLSIVTAASGNYFYAFDDGWINNPTIADSLGEVERNAYEFDGGNDWITIPSLTLSGDYEISFYIIVDSFISASFIRAFGSISNFGSRVLIWDNGMVSWVPSANGDRYDTAAFALPTGKSKVTVRREGSDGYILINDVVHWSGTVDTDNAVINAICNQNGIVTSMPCTLYDFDFDGQRFYAIDEGSGATTIYDSISGQNGTQSGFSDARWYTLGSDGTAYNFQSSSWQSLAQATCGHYHGFKEANWQLVNIVEHSEFDESFDGGFA